MRVKKNKCFVKSAVSRAVLLLGCPLGELPVYRAAFY